VLGLRKALLRQLASRGEVVDEAVRTRINGATAPQLLEYLQRVAQGIRLADLFPA
jgi:hypothetical protein